MTDVIDKAQEIIRNPAAHADPEKAMEALESRATEEERAMFPMLYEGLFHALQDIGEA